jgi:hypothetical protein
MQAGLCLAQARSPFAHLEIESIDPAKRPLPMTETGYRSWFGAPADVDAEGGPVEFCPRMA